MFARVLRLFLLIGVVLGIVAPKSSVVMAELGLIDAQVIVLCTGHGLETITIGPDGAPIKQTQDSAPCSLVHAADTVVPPNLLPWMGRLVGTVPQFVAEATYGGQSVLHRHARAPPVG